ncbi:MAG: SpoIIIAH-like family protein [Christensenellales bacterium]|jgi:hypothetical protein
MKSIKSINKSWIFTAALVLFTACAAAYILWPAGNEKSDAQAGEDYEGRGNFFEVFRQERELTRQEECRYLDEIIESASASVQAKRRAEDAKLDVVSRMEDEFIIESLLLAKNYRDVAVTISESGISVVLEGDNISDEDAARVLDIVHRQTGRASKDIYIINSK